MKIRNMILGMSTFFAMTVCYAIQDVSGDALQIFRELVIRKYVSDLQKADYKSIIQIFEKEGIVISTSRGKMNAKDFFSSFLPNIKSANTQLHQLFMGDVSDNHAMARFHFSFKLKDGEEGNGEYVDEFVFTDDSTKLSAVYMFENLKFKNEAKS